MTEQDKLKLIWDYLENKITKKEFLKGVMRFEQNKKSLNPALTRLRRINA